MGLGSIRRTVLVTGAAGFLGSHLVDQLLADGFEVIGLDNLMTGDLVNLDSASRDPHFHLEIGDVRETLKVYAEIIFNLACPASPIHYSSDPYATLTTSVLGAMRLVDHARLRNCRIVHASTSEVYGDPLEHPQTENYWGNVNPIGERACYDEGKRAAETLLLDARRVFGADARMVRIFNTYGPRMAFTTAAWSNFVTQVIQGSPSPSSATARRRALSATSPISRGPARRVARRHVRFSGQPGQPRRAHDDRARRSNHARRGQTGGFIRKPLPKDDPRRRCPDISKARRLLGFEPKTPIEFGLAETHAQHFQDEVGAEGVSGARPSLAREHTTRATPPADSPPARSARRRALRRRSQSGPIGCASGARFGRQATIAKVKRS